MAINSVVSFLQIFANLAAYINPLPSVALHLGRILPRTVFTDILHDVVEGHIVLFACSV